MQKVYFIGLDIAKNVFQVFLADEKGRQISNKKLKRSQVVAFFANLPACTIGMEACGSSHHWARTLQDIGHDVKLIQPRRVKAFLGGRNKTDAADARAICEALMHPGTRFVSIKTEEQQDLDHVLGMRERMVNDRTQLINQIRSYLGERGITIAQGRVKFMKSIKQILADHWEEFGDKFQIVLTESLEELDTLNAKIDRLDEMINKWGKENSDTQNLLTIPGFGSVVSCSLVSHIGDASRFENGRQMAAYIGLTPKEYSSGGKQKLLGITKQGNKRLRTLLIIAARAIMTGLSRRKLDENGMPLNLSSFEKWILDMKARIGTFKAAVALANKLARIAWAILVKKDVFNSSRACARA